LKIKKIQVIDLLRMFFVILVVILLGMYSSTTVFAQGAEAAYYTSIYATNGNTTSNVYGGGQVKVVVGQPVSITANFYNSISALYATLLTEAYVDGTFSNESSGVNIFYHSTGTNSLTISGLSPGSHTIQLQLYWNDFGTLYLEDTQSFTVYVVQLGVAWNIPNVDVSLGSSSGSTWTITLTNTGNDIMSNIVVSVASSSGLLISPNTQPLGELFSSSSKSFSFTVVAPENLAIGQKNVAFSVSYSDFEGNSYSLSQTATVNVIPTVTSISLSLSETTAYVGDILTLKATLQANQGALSGQTVSFLVNGTSIGSAITDTSGTATLNYQLNIAPGNYIITAQFLPTGSYGGSIATATLSVSAIPTTISLDAPTSVTTGDSVTITATLTGNGNGISGQTVIFSVQGKPIGSGMTDTSGKAIITYTVNLIPGTYVINATFQGNTKYKPVNGFTNLIVKPLLTELNLTVPTSFTVGHNVTFSAKLTDSNGNPISGQTVSFIVNGTVYGTAVTDASGTARINYSPSSPGTVQVEATYSGQGTYAQSSSRLLAVTINSAFLGLSQSQFELLLIIVGAILVVVLAVIFSMRRRNRSRSTSLTET
jgi:hypothetical protein